MMSQTHVLLASAILAKPGAKLRNTAVITGAILPDIAIYGLLIWSKLQNIPEAKVWNELYWQDPWQTYTAAGNSVPIYGLLVLLGLAILRGIPGLFRLGVFAVFLAMAAFIHIAGDLPVHVVDAHRHFWPISDWKFISPVSYWDPNHHGRSFMVFEAILGLGLSGLLFKQFKNWAIRVTILICVAAYLAVPAYFILQLG